MNEINYKDLQINPFNLIGDEWMLVTAGNPATGCNTMYIGEIVKVLR